MATFNLIADVAFLAEMAGDSERVDLLKKVQYHLAKEMGIHASFAALMNFFLGTRAPASDMETLRSGLRSHDYDLNGGWAENASWWKEILSANEYALLTGLRSEPISTDTASKRIARAQWAGDEDEEQNDVPAPEEDARQAMYDDPDYPADDYRTYWDKHHGRYQSHALSDEEADDHVREIRRQARETREPYHEIAARYVGDLMSNQLADRARSKDQWSDVHDDALQTLIGVHRGEIGQDEENEEGPVRRFIRRKAGDYLAGQAVDWTAPGRVEKFLRSRGYEARSLSRPEQEQAQKNFMQKFYGRNPMGIEDEEFSPSDRDYDKWLRVLRAEAIDRSINLNNKSRFEDLAHLMLDEDPESRMTERQKQQIVSSLWDKYKTSRFSHHLGREEEETTKKWYDRKHSEDTLSDDDMAMHSDAAYHEGHGACRDHYQGVVRHMPRNPYAKASKRHHLWHRGFTDAERGLWSGPRVQHKKTNKGYEFEEQGCRACLMGVPHDHEDEEHGEAYDRGIADQTAAHGKHGPTRNPFAKGTPEHDIWIQGVIAQMKKMHGSNVGYEHEEVSYEEEEIPTEVSDAMKRKADPQSAPDQGDQDKLVVPGKVNPSKPVKNVQRTFVFVWKNGKKETGTGEDIAKAFMSLGHRDADIEHLDYWEETTNQAQDQQPIDTNQDAQPQDQQQDQGMHPLDMVK